MEIKLSKLRIGNYVRYNEMIVPIYSIRSPYPSEDRFNNKPTVDLVCGGIITATLDEISGIELSDEILFDFGFDIDVLIFMKRETEQWSFIVSFHDCWHIHYIEKKGYGDNDISLRCFPLLHEFQNIYQELTGEDLNLLQNKENNGE